tara:strand:+ start:74 stop:397 length:324 start_codon:yes stop_codon:yes gene_type:complete
MGQIFVAIGLIVFGLVIGGVGLASAGVGIRIPMIPLGVYLMVRGFHSLYSEQKGGFEFEKTKIGKIGLAILLIILALGTGGNALLVLAFIGLAAIIFYSLLHKKEKK